MASTCPITCRARWVWLLALASLAPPRSCSLDLRPQDNGRIELVLDGPVTLTQLGRYSFKCQ
jgi:hypothetical protein